MSSTRADTPTAEALSREAIARVDSSNQLGDVLGLPEHLRDALWRAEHAPKRSANAHKTKIIREVSFFATYEYQLK